MGLPIRAALKTNGYFHHAWILPYGIIVILLAFIFARFILSFPTNIRNQMFLTGFVFIFGKLILESFSGNLVSLNWPNGKPDIDQPNQCLDFINCLCGNNPFRRFISAKNYSKGILRAE